MTSERRQFARGLRRQMTRARKFCGRNCATRDFMARNSGERSRSIATSSIFVATRRSWSSNWTAGNMNGSPNPAPAEPKPSKASEFGSCASQHAEPLLSFASGALVHFAVSNIEVRMATRLAGPETTFCRSTGAITAARVMNRTPTATRLCAICGSKFSGRYIAAEKDKKMQISKLIFPRYHQLDTTRKLFAAVREEGAGGKYLIQHSAGSGKTELHRLDGALSRRPVWVRSASPPLRTPAPSDRPLKLPYGRREQITSRPGPFPARMRLLASPHRLSPASPGQARARSLACV